MSQNEKNFDHNLQPKERDLLRKLLQEHGIDPNSVEEIFVNPEVTCAYVTYRGGGQATIFSQGKDSLWNAESTEISHRWTDGASVTPSGTRYDGSNPWNSDGN